MENWMTVHRDGKPVYTHDTAQHVKKFLQNMKAYLGSACPNYMVFDGESLVDAALWLEAQL